MNLKNITEVRAALAAGDGIYKGMPLFLRADGSIRNILNNEIEPANEARAALYAEYVGFVPADDTASNALAASGLFVPLVAVAAEAPAVTGLPIGALFFNSTDKKLYVLEEGEGEDPPAWAEHDPNITAGGKVYYVSSGASAGLYSFSVDTLALL